MFPRPRVRRTSRRAHPDNGTDPFNPFDLDEIVWGGMAFDDDFGFATTQPTEDA